MHVPAFLFRVYVFQVEFERYSMSHHIQYPVPTTLDFALHVCNNREASIRGLNRCLDVKDAFCSLLQKGHILGSPSPLLLIGDHEGSVHTMGKSNRHLSMDGASAFSFASPSFLSPARRTLSEESSLFPSLLTPDDFPDFHFSLHSSFPRESSGLFTFHDLPSSHDSLDDPRGNPDWLPTRRSRLLQSSFDELQEPRRRASSFALPGFANTPSPLLSHGEVALLPPLPDAADGFSLRPPAASPEGSSLLGGRSGLNPHSAEFVPHALHLGSPDSGAANASITNSMNPAMTTAMNPAMTTPMTTAMTTTMTTAMTTTMTTPIGRTKTGKPGKAASKRDLLEETMLAHRIEENHILTLKLRGLPYSASKQDIAAFFAPLQLPRDALGEPTVVIGQDSLQRPSGEAFVTFASVEDCEKGLRYHMKHLGRRYIEIFPLFNKEYYRKNAIYCSICNKYGHTDEACVMRFRGREDSSSRIL
ncbi:hypothetical protein WA556_000876 [Blastocystis sp. ATCC 50177/Nand II]